MLTRSIHKDWNNVMGSLVDIKKAFKMYSRCDSRSVSFSDYLSRRTCPTIPGPVHSWSLLQRHNCKYLVSAGVEFFVTNCSLTQKIIGDLFSILSVWSRIHDWPWSTRQLHSLSQGNLQFRDRLHFLYSLSWRTNY